MSETPRLDNELRATNDRLRASNSALNVRATQAEASLAKLEADVRALLLTCESLPWGSIGSAVEDFAAAHAALATERS